MVVSVVTKGISDDANGSVIAEGSIWLRVSSMEEAHAFHYSNDGPSWNMLRLFRLDPANVDDATATSIGFCSQAPVGPSCEATFEDLRYNAHRLVDPRGGS